MRISPGLHRSSTRRCAALGVVKPREGRRLGLDAGRGARIAHDGGKFDHQRREAVRGSAGVQSKGGDLDHRPLRRAETASSREPRVASSVGPSERSVLLM